MKKTNTTATLTEVDFRYIAEEIPAQNSFNANQGWVCPKCGRVFAPHIHTCPNCTVKEYETTQSTTMICD